MLAPKLLAVDTNVLIDYAAGDEIVIDCFSTVSKRLPKSKVCVLPTVIQELVYIADNADTRKKRELAIETLQSIVNVWGFYPVNCLPVGHGIAEQTALKLRKQGIVPDEEINDALIIAEAALVGVSILLTNDSHLRDIDQSNLKFLLEGCHLTTLAIFSPHRIVRDFFNSVH